MIRPTPSPNVLHAIVSDVLESASTHITYDSPTRKMLPKITFRDRVALNRAMIGIGSKKIHAFNDICKRLMMKMKTLKLKHLPGISRFQV